MDSGFRGPKFADAVAENGVELVGDLNFFLQGARGIRHWGLTLPPPSTQLWVCLNGQIHLYTLVGIGPSKIYYWFPGSFGALLRRHFMIRHVVCTYTISTSGSKNLCAVQREEKRAKASALPFLSSCPGVNSCVNWRFR